MLSSIVPLFRGRSLLHMGCSDCGNDEAYLGVKVLNKMGMDVDVKEFSCGCEFFGTDEGRIEALAGENRNLLKDYSMIIVGCARCYHVLREYYDIKVKHISQVIYEELRSFDGRFIGSGEVLYHDPCYLARFHGLVEEPREVLKMLGYEVREFKNNRAHTDCCGDYSPIRVLRQRGAELRLSQAPKKSLITSACPKCTKNLSEFAQPEKSLEVRAFLDLVDHALNVEIPAVY